MTIEEMVTGKETPGHDFKFNEYALKELASDLKKLDVCNSSMDKTICTDTSEPVAPELPQQQPQVPAEVVTMMHQLDVIVTLDAHGWSYWSKLERQEQIFY